MNNCDLNQDFSIHFDLKLIPRLINIQRIIKFQTSYSEPSYIILSTFGRTFRITKTMYKITRQVDGKQSLKDLACEIKEKEDLDVSPETLWELFKNDLVPRSIITFSDEEFDTIEEKLRSNSTPFRVKIFPWKAQLLISQFFSRITSLPILLILIGCFFGLTLIINKPKPTKNIDQLDFLIILMLMFIGILIHELGHSSAAVRGKIQPGSIGIRFLLWFPVLSIDVNSGWILDRKSRIELDLGGIGLQSGFGILLLLLSDFVQSPSLFIASSITFSIVCLNIVPFPRFDGYWFLTDALGIPNLSNTALSILRRPFSKKSNVNTHWGSLSLSIQFILFCYGLFTVFSIALMIFYLIQLPLLFLALIINIPQFIEQIKTSFSEGNFLISFYQIIGIIFSLTIFVGFVLMFFRILLYFKSRFVQKFNQRIPVRNNDNIHKVE